MRVDEASIFYPIAAVIALTLIAFFRMAIARGRAVKETDRDPAYYRAFLGAPEPEYAIVAVRHYGNLFELPVLFYVGCISSFVLGSVSIWTLVWAWAYVVARITQSAIHLTYNAPAHRGMAFVLGLAFVAGLWINVLSAVISRP